MTHESITLGILTLTATIAAGPIITVRVRSVSGDVGTLHLSIGEWTSLRAVVDVLAAADRRHAEDHAALIAAKDGIDRGGYLLKQAQAAMREQAAAFDAVAEQRDTLRAERDVLRQECRELTEQRNAARADMEAAEQRMLGVLDGTFAVGDGSAQREIERLRTIVDRHNDEAIKQDAAWCAERDELGRLKAEEVRFFVRYELLGRTHLAGPWCWNEAQPQGVELMNLAGVTNVTYVEAAEVMGHAG